MNSSQIKKNVRKILSELPDGVELIAAAKTRTPKEIQTAIDAGIALIGENYVQEAEEAQPVVEGELLKWHLIGHLQRNKVKRAVNLFDMVESLDSFELARDINKECVKIGKKMECLVEINSGREDHKYGFFPEKVDEFIAKADQFENINIVGLMTMGPFMGDPDDFRPYFKTTHDIFTRLKDEQAPNCEMKYLSMGMSASYKVAIEEGANMVRIGTDIFGPRDPKR